MTTPVSSANSCVYDPSAQMSFADGSGPAPSAGPPASTATFVASFACGEDLAAYFECENP